MNAFKNPNSPSIMSTGVLAFFCANKADVNPDLEALANAYCLASPSPFLHCHIPEEFIVAS